MAGQSRGVTSVIAIVLMVAVTVVVAATVSVVAIGLLENVRDPAPTVAQSSGKFLPQDGNDGGIVQITHVSGDTVAVSDIEISVRAACLSGTKEGRIGNLPAGDQNAIRESQGQITGDNIFDERSLRSIDNNADGVTDGGALLHQEQFVSGDTILFRLPSDKCELTQGREISVQVVHVPSESIIIEQTLRA